VYTLSQKKNVTLSIFVISLSSNFASFWQKETPGKIETNIIEKVKLQKLKLSSATVVSTCCRCARCFSRCWSHSEGKWKFQLR